MSNFIEDLWTQIIHPAPRPPAEPWEIGLPALWRRQWRLTGELVHTGQLVFRKDGIFVTGRRTNIVRGALFVALRLVTAIVLWASFAAVLLTATGVAWRVQSVRPLLWLPLLGGLALLAIGGVFRGLYRALLEPRVTATVPWSAVRGVATDGHDVEVVFDTPFAGRLCGRLTADGSDPRVRTALGAMRDGLLPSIPSASLRRPMRPVWIDRLAGLAGVAVVAAGAWALEPAVSARLLTGGARGPVVPVALSVSQVEALRQASCRPLPASDSVTLRNAREGRDLTWTVTGPGDWVVVPLRLGMGTGRFEVLDPGDLRVVEGLPDEGDVGVTLLVPAGDAASVRDVLTVGTVDALYVAWCAGKIARMDFTVATPPSPPALTIERDGDDLVAAAPGLAADHVALAVRARGTPLPDPFDPCELPFDGDEVVAVPMSPARAVWPGFFRGIDDDPGRVYLIPTAHWPEVQRALSRGGAVQRCLALDSLRWSGRAVVVASTPVEVASELRERAARTALTAAPWRSDAVKDTLVRRWAAVREAFGDRPEARDGLFDAVDYASLLDAVDFTVGPRLVEPMRLALNEVAPELGDAFVLRLGQAFMDRSPVHGEYADRYLLAEAWALAPEASPANLVGRYLLLDLARQIELDLPRLGLVDTLGTLMVSTALWVEHGIAVQPSPSDSRKAIVAWGTGQFEYVIGRVVGRVATRVLPTASAAGRYRLAGDEHPISSVRLTRLLRDDVVIGRVALFAPPSNFDLAFADREEALRQSPRPVLAASAAYVNQAGCSGEPAQYTAVDGVPRADRFALDQGGLVLLTGGTDAVRILDIRDGGQLPGAGRPLRPMRRLTDYAQLHAWIRSEKADAFQTHVLYADGKPRIHADRADGERSRRRMLVEAKVADRPTLAVVDLETEHTLFGAMETAVQALETPEPDGPGWVVSGVANLDVGACDVVAVEGVSEWEGQVPIARAQNLITISFR